MKLSYEHAIWQWITEYSSYLMNQMEVGHDGKTAYERCKGKSAKVNGIKFGEGILWKKQPQGGGLGNLQSMWNDGIFLGIKGTTGEFIIGDRLGIKRTRTIQRKPFEKRWDAENLKIVAGVPWVDE